MPLKVAVQMDHISRLNIRGDSTFALMLEGERRGHSLYHYTPDRLSMRDGRVEARVEPVEVRDEEGSHYTLGAAEPKDLSTFDVVLLRQDPPFDMGYITTTHILERIHPKTLVVNDPAPCPERAGETVRHRVHRASRRRPSSAATGGRSSPSARRMATSSSSRSTAMAARACSGSPAATRTSPPFSRSSRTSIREPFVIQRYLPDVRKGDKRIILVEGEPVGIINRVPAAGEARSNMHVGGRPEPVEMTARDREICAAIGPTLRERGLIFVGIDVIGDYLTEINVTSPTGIREVKRFGGADIAALVWDAIESRRAEMGSRQSATHTLSSRARSAA